MASPSESLHPLETRPLAGETAEAFARRLELDGAREIVVRKALRRSFGVDIPGAKKICDELPAARAREVTLLVRQWPMRTRYSHMLKVKRNLDLSEAEAYGLVDAALAIGATAGGEQ